MSSATPSPAPRSPWRRRGWRALAVLAALVSLSAGAIAVLLHNLDQPWVKLRVQRLVRSSAAIELDYARAEGALGSGLRLEGLQIATPEAFRAFAPHLVTIGTVEVGWGLPRLLRSSPSVDTVSVRDVVLTIVLDRSGHSSLELGGPAPTVPPPASTPSPLSRLLRDLFAAPLPARQITISPVRCRLLRVDGPQLEETITLDGLRAEATTSGRGLALTLGTSEQPLALVARREGPTPGEARLTLRLSAETDPQRAHVSLELRLLSQDLVAAPKVDTIASLEAEARFLPEEARVVVAVTKLALADGAVMLSAEVEQADEAKKPPLLRALDAHVDVTQLAALAPPTLAIFLPRLARGGIEVSVKQLELTSPPRLLQRGTAHASGTLEGIEVTWPGLEASARSLTFDLRVASDQRLDGEVGVQLRALRYASGKARLEAQGGKLALKGRALRLDALPVGDSLEVELALASVSAALGGLTIEGKQLALRASGAATARPPFAAAIELGAARLVATSGRSVLVDEPLKVKLALTSAYPDLARLVASRAKAHLELGLGALTLELDAQKAADAVDYSLTVSAPTLGMLGRMAGGSVSWSKMALALRSAGRIDGLSGPIGLRHDSTATIERPTWHGAAGVLGARTLSVTTRSSGSLRKHEGELALGWTDLRRDGGSLGDGKIATSLSFDAAAPTLDLKTSSSGPAAPEVAVKLLLGYDRPHRRLAVDLTTNLKRLEPLSPVLALVPALRGFRLAGLALSISVHGSLGGLVDGVRPDGTPLFASGGATRLAGDLAFDVGVTGLKWHDRDRSVDAPEISWRGSLDASSDRRTLRAALGITALHLAFGPTRLDLSGLGDTLVATLVGDPQLGHVELRDKVTLRALRQELVPAYPTSTLAFSVHASRDADGIVRIPELRVDNGAAGTTATLSGGLDLGEDRRSLSLRGSLTQDLGKLWSDRQVFVGKGSLSTDVHVESGDLRLYRTRAALHVKDATLELPRQKVKIEAIDGEIPIVADVRFGKDGPRLLRAVEVNSYSELRFIDQHPLLSTRSYLSIGRLETPWATIAPLAGNLIIDNNMLSMSQLELGVRGGRVSGRALIALQGMDTKAQLNVRASGVRSTRGEPFDGNIAVGVSVRQHSVQGRAEILRIGRRHLLDLLDVVDPPRVDAAINRVRSGLALGYPDQVRVSFNRGFASAKITLGGIARLLKIDEIRGIPMGPIIDRVLEPFLEDEEE